MISLDNCPLLEAEPDADALVSAYNAAEEQVALFGEVFGRSFDDDESLVRLKSQLDVVRSDLTKSRYSIGFIGPTQSGKSTTVNYVLDAVEPDDQPCKEGTGDNTTSTVSRLLNGSRAVRLIYMTSEQYEAKRRQLCESSGLAAEASDQALLEKLPGWLKNIKAGSAEVEMLSNGEPILEHDVRLLSDLLQAYGTYGRRLVSDDGVQVDVPYEDRSRYLNYGAGADPANPLLREAVIRFDSQYLAPELQIFDLPGPGAKSTVDEWTTRQYLPEMDGIMLFLSCTKLGDEAVERLYAQLRQLFKERTSRRVWIVLTRWDGPTHAALNGDGEESVFSAINRLCEDKQLPHTQIRFVCGPWYTVTDSANFVNSHFQSRLGGKTEPGGLSKHPDLEPNFAALFESGGITSLRDLVLKDLPRDVRAEIIDTSAERIKKIRSDLARRFKNEVRRRTANDKQAGVATKCRKQMSELVIRMGVDLPPFEGAAVKLREDLTELFSEICESAEALDHFGTAPDDFASHAIQLQKKLTEIVETRLVPDLYGAWQAEFDALPNVQVLEDDEGKALNVGEAWQYFAEKDEQQINAGSAQFPTFLDSHLFATRSDPHARQELAKGEAFWSMMKEKISLVSQQVVHAIRTAQVKRGLEIKRELEQISRADLGDDSSGRSKSGIPPTSAPSSDLEQALVRMEALA